MSPSIEKSQRPLQYYLHDDPDAFRMELAGSLTLATTGSVYHAWRTAMSTLNGRRALVDITFVDGADEGGRALLLHWHQNGTGIVARTPESRALAAGIPLETPRVERPAGSFGGRVMARLRRAIGRRGKSSRVVGCAGVCNASS